LWTATIFSIRYESKSVSCEVSVELDGESAVRRRLVLQKAALRVCEGTYCRSCDIPLWCYCTGESFLYNSPDLSLAARLEARIRKKRRKMREDKYVNEVKAIWVLFDLDSRPLLANA
jgi:hypothetical protein